MGPEFATSKYAIWDIYFKLVIFKKPDSGRDVDLTPLPI